MIIGSFHKDKLVELMSIPSTKECFAYSVSSYDLENKALFSVLRSSGEVSNNKIDDTKNFYQILYEHNKPYVKHTIQPASRFIDSPSSEHYLWFDGSLDKDDIEKIQFEEGSDSKVDSELMLLHIVRYGRPSNLFGAISGMYSDGVDMFIFRNEFESLFYDDDLNICSLPFVGSKTLDSNKMFKIDFDRKTIKEVDQFTTIKRWNV